MRAESDKELNTLWEEVKLDEVFGKEIVSKTQKKTSLLSYMEQHYMNKQERWVMHFRRKLSCFLKTMQTNNHTESWHKTLKDADAFKLRGNIKYHIMLTRMASGTRDRNKQYRDEQNRTYILRTGTHYNDGIHYCSREARTLTRTIPVLNAMIANDCKAKSEDMINRCVEEVHDNERSRKHCPCLRNFVNGNQER